MEQQKDFKMFQIVVCVFGPSRDSSCGFPLLFQEPVLIYSLLLLQPGEESISLNGEINKCGVFPAFWNWHLAS